VRRLREQLCYARAEVMIATQAVALLEQELHATENEASKYHESHRPRFDVAVE
jgi:cyanophycinase-like exopeptidase